MNELAKVRPQGSRTKPKVGGRASRPSILSAKPHYGWLAALLAASALAGLTLYVASRSAVSTPGDTKQVPHASGVTSLTPVLPPPNLLKPLTPEEAAKQNLERPFVNRADTPASKFVLKTGADDRSRALDCLTQAVYYEAAGEGTDGGRAVAQVVLNRMHHPGYPNSVCGVVYQGSDRTTGCQFTFTCDGSLLRAPVTALWNRSRKIAEDALAGHVFAQIGHATHYHADYVLPYWADSLDKTVQIGRHIFYRLRSSMGDSRAFFQRYAGKEPAPPEPPAPTIIPPQAVTKELANALLSDRTPGLSKDVEKAAGSAGSALLADNTAAELTADGVNAPTHLARKKVVAGQCGTDPDQKRLTPLAANDVRSIAGPGC